MRTAKELFDLANIPADNEQALKELENILGRVAEHAFKEMTENPNSRKDYFKKPLMVLDKNYDNETIEEFAKYASVYGFFVYEDPLYGAYTVYFDKHIQFNPYRRLIES